MDAVLFLNLLVLLFLFHLVHSKFVLQPGIRLDLPEASFSDGMTYDAMVVTVSQEGMVFFQDQRTTMEGLEESFRRAVREQKDARLILEADGRVPHRTLVGVCDMAARAGIRKVLLATRLSAAPPEGNHP